MIFPSATSSSYTKPIIFHSACSLDTHSEGCNGKDALNGKIHQNQARQKAKIILEDIFSLRIDITPIIIKPYHKTSENSS